VHETDGLPEDAMLSVRAGNTRRQAPLPLTEPLRFPNLPFNAKHFKVDVLKTLGTARLDIHAQKEQESYSVGIDLPGGKKAVLGLTIREEPSLCGKRAFELKQVDRGLREKDSCPSSTVGLNSVTDGGNSASKVASETREYAREHNIPNLVQEMLQYVLRERPKAPFAVMAAHMRRKAMEMGEDVAAFEAEFAASAGGASLPSSTVPKGIQEPAPKRLSSGETANDVVKAALLAADRTLMAADRSSNQDADPERLQMQAEHLALRAERAALLRELAELDTATLAGLS